MRLLTRLWLVVLLGSLVVLFLLYDYQASVQLLVPADLPAQQQRDCEAAQEDEVPDEPALEWRRPRIARVISSTTGAAQPLLTHLLPSLLRTMEPEAYVYGVFLDAGDAEACAAAAHIRALWHVMVRTRNASWVPPVLQWFVAAQHSAAAQAAYERGWDYFYRVHDDTELQTRGWTSTFVRTLLRTQGVGVVAPRDLAAHVFTHSMVSRVHFDIFPSASGWDDAIDLVYAAGAATPAGAGLATMVTSITVRRVSLPVRYTVYSNKAIEEQRLLLKDYLEKHPLSE